MNRRFLSLVTPIAALVLAGVFGIMITGSAQADDAECRPDGLYKQSGVDVPYCDVYDTAGRETMDSPRRSIGYFASWRTGKDGTPAYLVNDIPWNKITHINYAFAHVKDDKISVGSPTASNPAIGMEWPGVPGAEMDPDLSYKGHFNLLNKYKKQHPNVKTLISVGGWAETGGYFGDDGKRVANGGFYTLAESQTKINTFADSVVDFLRKYGFDGVDIDYEYATSANHAGNPLDFQFSDSRRATLMSGYVKLMKTIREKLNAASAADGKYYMSTAAVSASGWILRGSESYQVTEYLDYANIMSYDLHGAWNHFVGPNAALYDDGTDSEMKHWNVYGTYGMGYLNTDWAYHYFRGSMPAGRINIGTPFYTRGWRNVNGGTNGLWGTSALADQTKCPAGTGGDVGSTVPCGDGALGIDNLWHDKNTMGGEEPAGANPMWHAKNLEEGIQGSYIEDYGLDPENDPTDRLTGTYSRHYADTMEAPWLWNADKKVFLSTEDEESMAAKTKFVIDQGLGGIMFWEMSGDYDWDADAGEYRMGTTLIDQIDAAFANAGPYDATKSNITMPDTQLNVDVTYSGYAVGDANYPINPTMTIKNNSSATIPGGAVLEFDYATSAPCDMTQQSGWTLSTVKCGHTGGNTGGLKGDFQRVALTVPSWQTIAPGASVTVKIVYRLPISTPSNYVLKFGGKSYALSVDHPRLGDPGGDPTSSSSSPTSTPTTDPPDQCTEAAWESTKVYNGGNKVSHKGHNWQAKWWTQGEEPGTTGEWGVWRDLGAC
ncbi:chitinase C-terminal domain-containing protein [Stackebrandtia nassauensis]|uniref:Chitinase n=1 Tax=Stackebrandtia nassauensis (strain DSM 44728 / CIP 108903 / NRRL B-16338 / NBRC 102104 / LLR-40K-21) TaxID=446470 RepID=D3Q3N6_STANL|nr:glycosyl hydrolase family 18 protein [Stackebrandtia nassauensis]ADD43953.1 Chitinase [Stackebrandtia nassauensis DSM 44728]